MDLGRGSYRAHISEILQQFNREIDENILEFLKIALIDREGLQCVTLMDVYNVILKHNKNDFKDLILKLTDFVLDHIKDIAEDFRLQITNFRRRLTHDAAMWMIEEESRLHGRDSQLDSVYNLILNESSVNFRLINVWGKSGTGKSFFIKHLAAKFLQVGEVNVIHVDLRNAYTIVDLLTKILIRMNLKDVHPLATASELAGQLFASLRSLMDSFLGDCTVLILDNVSALVMTSGTAEFLSLLHKVLMQRESDSKLKIVVTSREPVLASHQAIEFEEQMRCEEMMKYTHDIELKPLDHEAFELFSIVQLTHISGTQVQLTPRKKPHLLCLAGGCPYKLNLLTLLARDSQDFLLQEIADFTGGTSDAFIHGILRRSFHCLCPHQQKILLTLALFPDWAVMSTVCQMADVTIFSKEFNRNFWLSFQKSETLVQSADKTKVRLCHATITEFLKEMLNQYESTNEQCAQQIRMAYIEYYMTLLVELGRDYERNHTQTCDTIVEERINIRQAMVLLTKESNPQLIFKVRVYNSASTEYRSESDIACLFLCISVYQESFGPTLYDMLERLRGPSPNNLCSALIWSLRLLVLTLPLLTMRKELESTLSSYQKRDYTFANYRNLRRLCNGIYSLAEGALTKKIESFEKASDEFKKLKKTFNITSLYLSIHTDLYRARHSSCPDPQQLYKNASSSASTVKSSIPLVSMLKAAHYADTGCTERALKHYEEACKRYEELGQSHLNRSAQCLYDLSALHSKQDTEHDIRHAMEAASKALTIRADNSIMSHTKEDLLKSYEQMASCLHKLSELHQHLHENDQSYENRYKREALEYYRKAYDLIDSSGESCNLSANPDLTNNLLAISPHLRCIASEQLIKSVMTKLRNTRDGSIQLPDSSHWDHAEQSSTTPDQPPNIRDNVKCNKRLRAL
ncbi:uncharacterized protein [Watersipora subatra]|uniref:uncharacterized protein n=1 Tax=Watersipora subatra TaxID=2589382 RepID=UPI00355C80AB